MIMIPRGRLSISFGTVLKTILNSLLPKTEVPLIPNQQLYRHSLFCLSARTGLHLTLRALKLEPGTVILAANINIPDMFTILKEHGLVIQPISIEKETLYLSIQELENSLRNKTKAILVTHLFGAIANMDEIIAFAKQNSLYVIEDCAQAFNFNYFGHQQTDVVLFSFGLIKTNTCLTGAMVRFKNMDLFHEVDHLNSLLPQQDIRQYRLKLFKALVIKMMTSTFVYTLIYQLSQWLKKDFDQVLAGFTKGFPGADVMKKINYRPCATNLELLMQRTGQINTISIQQRKALAEKILSKIPAQNQIGRLNSIHTHWVLAILVENPIPLIDVLRKKGIDATAKASSLISLEIGRQAKKDQLILEKLVYLPIDEALCSVDWKELL
jgi:perosamine synthetase